MLIFNPSIRARFGVVVFSCAALLSPVVFAQVPPVVPTVKLPADTLTLSEAKAFVQQQELERAKLDTARKEVLKKGAKSTPAERAKLIREFRTSQQVRIKALQDQAPRVRELEQKIKKAEADPAAPTPAPVPKG